MDIISNPPYEELQKIYDKYFSLKYFGTDISNKFALISLVCYVVYKLKAKSPDVTHWSVLKKLSKDTIPEDYLKGIAVICSDFSYGCTEFPTFGIEDKNIPSKIKELLLECLPF